MQEGIMITTIDINKIHPHPENPRKDIGDIQELTESIKKNGIMQNLTVIPGHFEGTIWTEGDYTLIIGHRRFAAARAAEINELPCRIIEGMTRKEQISTMLEENMQRNDLTFYEEAQAFQLMLDLGENIDTIVQKTGFSRSTVHHRLNIAKLDGKELEKKEDSGFQLSLKDFYELEKIKSIETRNRILKEAANSRDLTWRARNAAREEKRGQNKKIWTEKLNALGLKEMTKKEEGKRYTEEFVFKRDIDLDNEPTEKLKVEGTHYYCGYGRINIYKENPNAVRQVTKEKEKERKRKREEREIKDILKKLDQKRKSFCLFVIAEKILPINGEKEMTKEIWDLLLTRGCGINRSNIAWPFLDKDYWSCTEEERKEVEGKTKDLTILQQLLILMCCELSKDCNIRGYQGEYVKEIGRYHQCAYDLLKFYGWSFEDDEEKAIIDGTHVLYREGK